MAKATTMGPMKIKESGSYRVFKVFNAIILTLISVAMLYPFLYLVAQSFSSTQAIVAGQVGLIPKDFNISTYKYVITDGKFIPYYGNTIVYSIIGTVCALLFSALLAYPLSKAELYGGKATLNLEELLATGAEVIIDLGDFKKSIADDLTALQEQTGLPCVFIEADLAHLADAFRTLGIILGKEERGEELAKLVEETMTMAAENSAKITEDQQLSVLYSSGSDPLGTNAEGSSQAQALGIVGAKNAVVLEDVSNKGGGNPINLEQLYRFDPDVILFAAGSIYAAAADDAAWQPLRAIEEGDFYEIPSMPYNWLSNPPSLNMLLGIWWLGNLLYPQYYDYDMVEKTQEIFQLFWDYDLSEEEARQMLANSTLKDTP